ncbi:MAG: hypothetical protein KAJ06_08085 [Gammaproteobacteria bacterium]|nr:hypothetical protein [Gammaproteobacteria bacterium]
MDKLVEIHGRPMKLSISKAAAKQLRQRTEPLLLEMELYFSCLVRKRVYVKESAGKAEAISLGDKLKVWFRPVVTETCAMRDVERDNPPVKDMPIAEPERYFPHWLTLDFRRGKWRAEFGYGHEAA